MERVKTYRAALRKIAQEMGLNPDDLSKSELALLEQLERTKTETVHVKEKRLRQFVVEKGFDPDSISRSDLYTLIRERNSADVTHS